MNATTTKALVTQSDVSEDEPFSAMARLGLALVQARLNSDTVSASAG